MEIEIATKPLRELTSLEHQICYALTLNGPSSMRQELDRISRGGSTEGMRALLLRREGQLVAWALLMRRSYRQDNLLYMFVAPDQRRQGLGSKLLREALRRSRGPVSVCPWNQTATSFYRACRPQARSAERIAVEPAYGSLAAIA